VDFNYISGMFILTFLMNHLLLGIHGTLWDIVPHNLIYMNPK